MTNRKSVGKSLQMAKEKLYSFIHDVWTPILINKMQLFMSTLKRGPGKCMAIWRGYYWMEVKLGREETMLGIVF